MRVIYSPTHLVHDPSFEVAGGVRIPAWEVPGRAEAIRGALAADPAFEIAGPVAHGLDPILAVHDPGLVGFLESAWAEWLAGGGAAEGMLADTFDRPGLRGTASASREPRNAGARFGYWGFDTTTPIVAGTWAATRDAVDVALTAADAILAGEPVAYGLCRPPGHHAGRAIFGGYCYLNNAAIATQWLVGRGAGGSESSTSTTTTGTGRRRSSGSAATSRTRRSTETRAGPTRTSPATRTRPGPVRAPGPRSTSPSRPGSTTPPTWRPWTGRSTGWPAGTMACSSSALASTRTAVTRSATSLSRRAAYHEVGRRVAGTGARLLVLQEGGYFIAHLGQNVRQWLRGAGGLESENRARRVDGPTATT